MKGRIEYCSFFNLTVSYGGAFFIQKNIDLIVHCLQISGITSEDAYGSSRFSGSAYIFIGKSFTGSFICGSDLISKGYTSACSYTPDGYDNILNFSCFSDVSTESFSIVLDKGNIIANDINGSKMETKNRIATIHFSSSPKSYQQAFFIGSNCTGPAIIGHSSSVSEIQICKNVVLIDNSPSEGLFGFWREKHKFIDSYFRGNSKSNVYSYSSNNIIIFENCYYENFIQSQGLTTLNPKTFFETNIILFPSLCFKKNQKLMHSFVSGLLNISTRANNKKIPYWSLILSVLLSF